MTANEPTGRRFFHLPRPKRRRQAAPPAAKPTWKREETAWASRLRSTARWQKLRERILKTRPLCSLCDGIADQVHHIDAKDQDKFFEPSNLTPICQECHEKVNSAYRRGIDVNVLFPPDKRITTEELLCLE